MPLAQGNSASVAQALKDLEQPFITMLWQSDDALDHIHDPAKDDFAGVMVSVPGFIFLMEGMCLQCLVSRVSKGRSTLSTE